MAVKTINILIIICLLPLGQFCRASEPNTADSSKQPPNVAVGGLQVYLPREITVKDDRLLLGQVGLVRGGNCLAEKASQILLGQISVPGQELVIDRTMVLSRLACNGIPASKVTLLGAEKVRVKQQQQTIKGNDFIKRASAFLKGNSLTASVCRFESLSTPHDFTVPETGKSVELQPRLVRNCPANQAKVQVAVLQDDKQVGLREVNFRLKYDCRRAVALVDIPAGAVINSDNVRIENTVSDYPEPADWKLPYGLVARRNVPANTILGANAIAPAVRPVVVERNQSVVIRIDMPGLLVTAVGKTLEEGRAGEHIKVRNIDSQRIIMAKVNEDGTLEPVL